MVRGLYIHIPFCRGKCPYCDFYSVNRTDTAAEYVAALLRAMSNRSAQAALRGTFDTLYIGGGTPTAIDDELLVKLIQNAQENFLMPKAEITVECNPRRDLSATFRTLAAAGVNRISMGMQSAVDTERRALGRNARAADVRANVIAAKNAGITNISLDLMLGIPGMTMDSLQKSIDFIKEANVPHISAYLLKIEEGTRFFEIRDQLALPDEDTVCALYLETVRQLEAAGLRQYEISNFARPGYESRHNLKYWRCEEYLGFGASAHSFFDGRRFYYPDDLDAFIRAPQPIDDGPGGGKEEELLLGLRLREGVRMDSFNKKMPEKAQVLSDMGFLRIQNGRVCMTPEGYLVSNEIIAQLLQYL